LKRDTRFRGCSAATSLFDPDGIITFESIDELDCTLLVFVPFQTVFLTVHADILRNHVSLEGFASRGKARHSNAKEVSAPCFSFIFIIIAMLKCSACAAVLALGKHYVADVSFFAAVDIPCMQALASHEIEMPVEKLKCRGVSSVSNVHLAHVQIYPGHRC
jgi:hypothetical protein